jgi:hypothetical protein
MPVRGRRAGALLALLVLAGCGEDAQQQAAREATQQYLAASAAAGVYDLAETHCTDSARTGFFRIEETSVFVCAVRRTEGGCDWFRAEARVGGGQIRLMERDAGCVLPE